MEKEEGKKERERQRGGDRESLLMNKPSDEWKVERNPTLAR